MSNFTEEQLAELKDYFRQYLGGVEITANTKSVGHEKLEYGVHTPSGQGIQIYEKGQIKLVSNTSIELTTGVDANKDTGHFYIKNINGTIHIEAPNGDIVLNGKNVQINATDAKGSVTIRSPHIIQTDAPQNTVKGSNVNITADHSLYCLSSYGTFHGDVTTDISTGNESLLNGSLLSRIISGIDEIKMFFKF